MNNFTKRSERAFKNILNSLGKGPGRVVKGFVNTNNNNMNYGFTNNGSGYKWNKAKGAYVYVNSGRKVPVNNLEKVHKNRKK
jgi:hypothetical protein